MSSRPPDADTTMPRARHIAPTILLAWFALLLIVVAAAWLMPPGLAPGRGASLLLNTLRWSNLWPVCLGGILAWTVWRLLQSERRLILPSVPAGDVIVLWWIARRIVLKRSLPFVAQFTRQPIFLSSLTRISADSTRLQRTIQTGESALASLPGVAISMAIVLGVFVFFLFCNT